MNALDIDTRTDIYSLGVVLYELLTGALPFDAKDLRRAAYREVQRIIQEVDPPRPSTRLSRLGDAALHVAKLRRTQLGSLERELRTELEWIPLKAMRKERSARYSTASALSDDVRNYLERRPLTAGPESVRYRLRKLLHRNRGPVTVASAVGLTLLAGAVVSTVLAIRLKHTADDLHAEQARTAAALDKAQRQEAEARTQAQEARKQAAMADAILEFHRNMLTAADPRELMGDQVTVLQAMRAAVKELDAGKLNDQPLVEAWVRHTISRTLLSLARYDEAEPNVYRALELRRKHLPSGHREIAYSLNYLGMLLRGQGKPAEAEPVFREALVVRRHELRPGQDVGEVGYILANLASVLRAQGKLNEAEPLLREALQIHRNGPPGHEDIATGLDNLGSLLLEQGRLAEAEPLLREALEINRKALPAGHPYIARSLYDLGLVLRSGTS